MGKLIYCSRTVPEIEKALEEMRNLVQYIELETKKPMQFLGLGLSSRKNMCIHPEIESERIGSVVDARCREKTASYIRAKTEDQASLCDFFNVKTYVLAIFISMLCVTPCICLSPRTHSVAWGVLNMATGVRAIRA